MCYSSLKFSLNFLYFPDISKVSHDIPEIFKAIHDILKSFSSKHSRKVLPPFRRLLYYLLHMVATFVKYQNFLTFS